MEKALSTLGLAKIRSSKELVVIAKEYPADASQYELLEDCGRGVSATVHRALCKHFDEVVAVKKLNLESMNCNLEEIIRETHTMKQYYHPNVLRLYTSFVTGQDLWMVMPYISGGSVLHIMKYAFPAGLEEVVIATIMKEVLKGLEYVHKQGGIHRDVKAGNILVDRDGSVKVGDFGVSATVDRGASWGNDNKARMTFVGTPCWMAPEVMEQTSGYDSSADIWSFGITLLELAHGHAPFAKFPPMKVLLMTLQNPPPTLDDKGGKHFSKHMRDVVTRCLQKDPKRRPSATELLQHKFFKQARDEEYLVKHLLGNLPSLGERVNQIRTGKAATNAQDNDRELEKSNEEYKKGVSCWNFDLAALKAQAALEPDESVPNTPQALPTIAEEGPLPDLATTSVTASAAASDKQAAAEAPPPAPINTSKKQHQAVAPSVFAGATSMASSIVAGLSEGAPTANGSAHAAEPPAAGQQQQQQQQPQPERSSSRSSLTHFYSEPPVTGASAVAASGATSPVNMSREGSTALAPLATVSTGLTPTASKQKTKGRFQVYEQVSEAPPFSPTADKAAQQQQQQFQQQQDALRPQQSERQSDDGAAAAAAAAEQAAALQSQPFGSAQLPPQPSAPQPPQPAAVERQDSNSRIDASETSKTEKQKGRFKITEVAYPDDGRQSMGKAPSASNLLVDGYAAAPRLKADVSYKSLATASAPAAAAAAAGGGGAGGLPLASVLPSLRELYEHSQAHSSALQRLITQVADADKGKPAPVLSRTVSKAGLFGESVSVSRSASEHGSELHSAESLSRLVGELRARVAQLEEENRGLRRLAAELAGGPSEGGSAAVSRRASAANLPAAAALVSPGMTPRQSQDEYA